jgi:hypothetical protein
VTMKILLNQAISCMIGSFRGGEEVDVPDNVALSWVKGGWGKLVEPEPQEEETVTSRPRRKPPTPANVTPLRRKLPSYFNR